MQPLVQIVNENDEIIGHKVRSEIDYSVDIYRSACLWIENTKGEVLVAQRSLKKDKHPGRWGPAVAGTVDEGETYESNIVKEAMEEIGLTGIEFKSVGKIRKNIPHRHFMQVFSVVVDKPIDEFNPQKNEVEQLIWVSKKKLVADISAHPEKYVTSMPRLLEFF